MLLIYGQCGYATLTQQADVELLEAMTGPEESIVVIGTTGASAVITAAGDMTGVAIGARAEGANIVNTPPSFVIAIDNNGHQVTLNQAATGVGAGEPITYTNPSVSPYTGALVMLYTNIITLPQKNPTVALLGEATYGGYARSSAVAWGPQLVAPDLSVFVSGDKKTFAATSSVTPNVVQGAAILAADGITVLQVCPFPSPVSFALAGQGCDFVPVVSMEGQT